MPYVFVVYGVAAVLLGLLAVGAILVGAHLGSFDMLRLISREYGLRVKRVPRDERRTRTAEALAERVKETFGPACWTAATALGCSRAWFAANR